MGGCVNLFKKFLFILVLCAFVGTSVWLTFNTISRDTFEYSYSEDIADTGVEGWVFDGFNGNSDTKEVRIYYVTDENGHNEDTSKPIVAVDSFTMVSDEYVEYIYIGPDVQYIDERAFYYCKLLKAVIVDDANQWYTDVNGILYTKDMSNILLYPICHCTQVVLDDIDEHGEIKNIGYEVKETLTITGFTDPKDLYSKFKTKASDDISAEAFEAMLETGVMTPYIGTYYLTKEYTDSTLVVDKVWTCDEKYVIPEGVKRIATNCFYKCDRLVSITLPSTLEEIGNMSFFKCYGISLVNLPDGLRTMGDDAFSYCEGMKYSIYIPESVESIGHHCFYQCDNLEVFYLAAQSEDNISLGGNWMPKGENSFSSDDPIFGATLKNCNDYNSKRASEEEVKIEEEPVVEEPVTEEEPVIEEPAIEDNSFTGKAKALYKRLTEGETNYLAVILMVLFIFIPCFSIVALQVVRNMFKEDFLMSKKKKEKKKIKDEEIARIYNEALQKQQQELEENNEREAE